MTKYKNKKVFTNIGVFDSKLELDYFNYFLILQKNKKINMLKRQWSINLLSPLAKEKLTYTCDFAYLDDKENLFVCDVKGFETELFKAKRKIILNNYSNFSFICLYKGFKQISFNPYFDNSRDLKQIFLNDFLE